MLSRKWQAEDHDSLFSEIDLSAGDSAKRSRQTWRLNGHNNSCWSNGRAYKGDKIPDVWVEYFDTLATPVNDTSHDEVFVERINKECSEILNEPVTTSAITKSQLKKSLLQLSNHLTDLFNYILTSQRFIPDLTLTTTAVLHEYIVLQQMLQVGLPLNPVQGGFREQLSAFSLCAVSKRAWW